MSFDTSRFTFNAWRDFLGVVMQQGRVQLDADWNELVQELVRRIQAGTLDTFSQTVVPRVTPDGFRILATGGALTIGRGRIYVDGILAENHGGGALAWDARLAEQTGTAALDYTAQPYYPQPPALPEGGPHLVYLDVWQREVTYLQYPDLVEKAVGVDTTARLQTVWQVKVLPNIGTAVCGSPPEDVPGWIAATQPSAGRLTTSTGAVSGTPNPCLIPPSGGYKGLENQLYRVEIHDGGTGAPTFKWSRNNATVASRVTQINNTRDRIVVESTGRDEVLRFSDGDWVEVTDDVRELHGQPGEIRRILLGGGVDDITRTLVLTAPLTAGEFPTNAQGETSAARNTRVRRWDHSGRVLRADGTLYLDLDVAGGTGLIPVPPAGTSVFLEDGILVSFDLAAGGGGYRPGDYWSFAARAADASIEILNQAPPRGIHHHYARLAIVTFPDTESDCRVLWPPEAAAGEDCSCDRCVTVEGHNGGTATLQQAVDALAPTGGVICLGTGIYRLREPLRIEGAGSLRIRGKGWRTLVLTEAGGPAVQINNSAGVDLESLLLVGAASTQRPGGLLDARNVAGLGLNRVYMVVLSPGDAQSIAVSLRGYLLGFQARECVFVADTGVRGGSAESDGFLLTASVAATDNLFLCTRAGLRFGRRSLHYGETRIARNLMLRARDAVIEALGAAVPGSTFLIEGNVLQQTGNGIVAGVDGLRILDNELQALTNQDAGAGVTLTTGLDPSGIGHCWITGNRIAGMQGAAISVQTAVGAGMIKQNILERSRGGIVFTDAGSAEHVSIENNQLLQIAAGFNPAGESIVGIQILSAKHADVSGNIFSGFAAEALQARDRAALRVIGSTDVRVSGNHFSDLGPVKEHAGLVVAIDLIVPFRIANVTENIITRSGGTELIPAAWHAIRISRPRAASNFNGVLLLPAGDDAFLLTSKRLSSVASRTAESAQIRANQIRAVQSFVAIVDAQQITNTLFSDNHCEGQPGGANQLAMVVLGSEVSVVSQNRVHWTGSKQDAIHILGEIFTVLGNVTMGNILVTPALQPLPAVWAPLNIVA